MSDLDLRVLLALERLELNLFRGRSPIDDRPRIFGGQVIAQALLAAYETVTDRVCHSLHAYFIRPGDPRIPIIYEVDRARDGASFTTRRVIAIQNGRQIFNMAASFQQPEGGVEHQDAMPQGLPGPDGFPTLAELETNYLAKQAPPRSELRGPDPFDMAAEGGRQVRRVELADPDLGCDLQRRSGRDEQLILPIGQDVAHG